MKLSTLTLLCSISTLGGSQAFAPTAVNLHRGSILPLYDSNDSMLEKATDAVADAAADAADAVIDTVDDISSGLNEATKDIEVPEPANGLDKEEEQEMWEAQRALQANRNEHSKSKEARQKKYEGAPIIENDKHGELNEPWTKSYEADDHYSANGKL